MSLSKQLYFKRGKHRRKKKRQKRNDEKIKEKQKDKKEKGKIKEQNCTHNRTKWASAMQGNRG